MTQGNFLDRLRAVVNDARNTLPFKDIAVATAIIHEEVVSTFNQEEIERVAASLEKNVNGGKR